MPDRNKRRRKAANPLRRWLGLPRGKRLEALPADATPGLGRLDKQTALAECEQLRERLRGLQARLYAEGERSLLVVFQAMDTGGKDGAIRRVFTGVNPQGVGVASFKKPTPEELAHDFLWRVHAEVPARGMITVFNRSHYEDVLIVRVHGWIDDAEVERRYQHIRDFEQLLSQQGTRVVKFYLHIDRDEQKERLEARLRDPEKLWKFNPADLDERAHWADYMSVYQNAIRATHSAEAPWYVIPANRKWFRDWAVLSVLVATLEEMDPRFPSPSFDPATITVV